MDNKLYRVRAQLNFYSQYRICYLKITDHYFEWVEKELGGTKLTKEEANALVKVLLAHGRKGHGYKLIEVEPAYIIKFESNKKIDSYFNGVACDGSSDIVNWVNDLKEVPHSFDKASAIKYQEALKTLFDISTELIEYYEHR